MSGGDVGRDPGDGNATNGRWSSQDIPSLVGKTAVVTGANSGIGYFTALELARAGAHVIIACRDRERALDAVERMRKVVPDANVEFDLLDLASLESIRTFSDTYRSSHAALDILVNNAGVMAIPTRTLTADGFEMQFGTNHLGHFALTGRLLDCLLASAAPRVVTVSSGVTMWASLDLENLQGERRYRPMRAYGQSKLANLLFMVELDRRARVRGLVSVGVHPGAAITNLQRFAFGRLVQFAGQSAEQGALPSLFAASAAGISGGSYFGPCRWFGLMGAPTRASIPQRARDEKLALAVWERSEALTGVKVAIHAETGGPSGQS